MPVPEGALSGLKVLDLTHYVAGPYATKLLAGQGARVIKVERPEGDPLRRIGPFYHDEPGIEHSCPFLYLNTDKQGVTLNLKSDTGRAIFRRLVEEADVLAESFRPGVMERLGFGYEALEQINPKLVMLSISNFGQTGPYRDYAITDLTAQAIGGVMNEMGEPDGIPLKLGGYQAMCAAGVAAYTATMTGVLAQSIHGFGQHVDVSIMEMMTYTEWHASCQYTYTGSVRKRQGRYNPWKILRCRDGYMGVVGNWPEIHTYLGLDDDERFATRETQRVHTVAMGEIIEGALINRDKMELYHEGQAAGVPWGFIFDMKDVMSSPHYAARDFFRKLEHPDVGVGTYAGMSFHIGDLPTGPWTPAPRLGEHNAGVYGERFGYDAAGLVRLHDMGII